MRRLLIFFALMGSVILAQEKKKDPPGPPPKGLYSVPLAISPGAKSKLLLSGNQLDRVMAVSAVGATVKVVTKSKKAGPNNYPGHKVGDSEIEFEIELPKDWKGEKIELRTSESVLFAVGVDPKQTLQELEPNDSFQQAQPLELPAVVNGTIHRERDVDIYRFMGKAGQTLQAEVQAARLGAPTDTLLTLYDATFRTLAMVDDSNGQPDPVLTYKLTADGVYYLSVIEAHDAGGAIFPYRLVVK